MAVKSRAALGEAVAKGGWSVSGFLGKVKILLPLMVTALSVQACNNLTAQHRRICEKNTTLIVHNEELWQEYRTRAEEVRSRWLQQEPTAKRNFLRFTVRDYKYLYGENKTEERNVIENQVKRDDIFILKDDIVVAQIVDYTYYQLNFGYYEGRSCLDYYNDALVAERTLKK